MREVEFEKEFRNLTEYKVRLSKKTIKELGDYNLYPEVIEAFKDNDPEKAVEKLNKIPKKMYKPKCRFEISETTMGNYLHVKKI